LAAGLADGHELWFGRHDNIGRLLAPAAGEFGIDVNVASA
jgi:hypothetical protein